LLLLTTYTEEYINLTSVTNLELSKKLKNSDLLADSHNILNRQKNFICQILNAHDVNDVRQTGTHTAKPLVPDLSSFEDETAIERLKTYKPSDVLS
jgi:hypothetical protein